MARRPWPEPLTTRLLALNTEGLSCSQIAERLGDGVTRNAVIGKLHRLGITKTQGVRRTTPNHRKMQNYQSPRKINPEPFVVQTPKAQAPPPLNLSIMEINGSTCKWPLGEPPFVYCGHPPLADLPYCEFHCSVAYTGAPKPKTWSPTFSEGPWRYGKEEAA